MYRCTITDVEIINQLAVAQSKLRRSDFSRRTLHALLIVRAAASALAEHAPSRCSQVSYMWIVSLHFIGRQRATEFGAFAGLFELVHDCELALFLRQTYLVPGFCLSSIALLVSRRLNLCAQKYAGVSQSSAARASNPTSNSSLQGQVHDCAQFALLVCSLTSFSCAFVLSTGFLRWVGAAAGGRARWLHWNRRLRSDFFKTLQRAESRQTYLLSQFLPV